MIDGPNKTPASYIIYIDDVFDESFKKNVHPQSFMKGLDVIFIAQFVHINFVHHLTSSFMLLPLFNKANSQRIGPVI